MSKSIEQRAIELALNPQIHDPEALRYLLDQNSRKGIEMAAQLLHRDGVIQQCRQLAEGHRGMCGVTDMIGKMLSEVPPVEIVPGMRPSAAPAPDVPPSLMLLRTQTARRPEGWFARARVDGTNETVGEQVGPFKTRDMAVNALVAALGKTGIVISPNDPGLDDGSAIRVAMGQRQVHQA